MLSSNQQALRQKGFTLIEVLIASVILFLFIMMAAQSFSQSSLSSLKAERATKVAASVPLLVETIRANIFAAKTLDDISGQGRFGEIEYRWHAKLMQRKPPITGFDPDTQDFRSFEDKFNLWNVDVYVGMGDYQRHWIYEELSWHEQ